MGGIKIFITNTPNDVPPTLLYRSIFGNFSTITHIKT